MAITNNTWKQLKNITAEKIIRALKRDGWEQEKGASPKYIKATGAKTVVTDNTRNHGIELANSINERLPGIKARPSTNNFRPR